jgi:ribosomal protein S18 acetylase RimI-like enzyme
MIIRPACPADLPALTQLARTTWAHAFGHTLSPADCAAHLDAHLSPAALAHLLAEDVFLAAEDTGRLTGFVQFGAYPAGGENAAELRRLYVHRDYQNRGIGSALLAAALAHPVLARAERIFLDVWEENTGAARLYARFGFAIAGARPFEVASGSAAGADLIMVRANARNS